MQEIIFNISLGGSHFRCNCLELNIYRPELVGFKKGNNFIILHLSRHKVVITLSFTHDVIFWEIYIINIAALFLLSAALAICAAYFLQL